jgi:RNA polymerase sigma factor (sigma-70 family)
MESLGAVPDGELWRRAASHDAPAFGEIFERHADAVYTHCFRRTGSWAVAEDLTSVVFLEAWRRRRQVQLHGDSVLPWLLAVANNSILNVDRSLRRQRRLLAKLPPPMAIPDHSDEAVSRIDDERTMAGILSAFRRLSFPDQDVLSLCDWAGLSYAEAALALAVPVGTVRSRLSRAREHLRASASEATGPVDPISNHSKGTTL